MGKWLLPVIATGGLALLLWLFLRRSDAGGGYGYGPHSSDPNAAAASALCTAGGIAYGGAQGGMIALPICNAAGPALAPVVGGTVDLAVEALDSAEDIIDATGRGASGAIEAF